jgi:uncharacterized membrane protein
MRKNPILRFLLVLVVPMFFLLSCEHVYITQTDQGTFPIDSTATVDTISFQTQVRPILQSKCTSCHFSGGNNPDMESANVYSNLINGNYISVSSPQSSRLFTLNPPDHARGYMTQTEFNTIVSWITQGAQNN